MQLDFIGRALLAGWGVALIAGPLGSIIVWRRLAYFGDTLAHSTLLGVCFAFLLNINLYIGLMIICLLVALGLIILSRTVTLAYDTILGILSHSSLALGLILATSIKGMRLDLLGYLYGDILAIQTQEIFWIYGINILAFLILCRLWRSILSITVHEELAFVEGVNVQKTKFILMLLIAFVFAIAMKLVGALLITALVIIPASTARQFASSPETMAVFASLYGVIAVSLGLWASMLWDWPAGPAIVIMAAAVFFLSLILKTVATALNLRNLT